jgi:hypothetical protein
MPATQLPYQIIKLLKQINQAKNTMSQGGSMQYGVDDTFCRAAGENPHG